MAATGETSEHHRAVLRPPAGHGQIRAYAHLLDRGMPARAASRLAAAAAPRGPHSGVQYLLDQRCGYDLVRCLAWRLWGHELPVRRPQQSAAVRRGAVPGTGRHHRTPQEGTP